jgi:hypothetical protein
MASNGNEQGTILLDPPLLRIWVPSCIIKKIFLFLSAPSPPVRP